MERSADSFEGRENPGIKIQKKYILAIKKIVMEALGLLGLQGSNNKELDNIELMSEV